MKHVGDLKFPTTPNSTDNVSPGTLTVSDQLTRARAEPCAQTFISHRSQVAHIISLCALPQLAFLLPPELAVSAHCAPTLPRYPKPEAFLHSLLPHEELAGRMARGWGLGFEL